MTIIAHCGGEFVDREQLVEVDTPPMDEITGWTPIAHHTLFDQVTNSLGEVGYEIVEEQHVLNNEGQLYFGLIAIRHLSDYQLLVGVRNSHNKVFSAHLACGSRVFVCDNLGFSGEVMLSRKHTRHISRDLPKLTMEAVGKLKTISHNQDQQFEAYKECELTNTQADHLIVQMLRNQIITGRQIPHIVKEWDSPSHPEFAQDGRTAWRLFNAVTEASKSRLQALPRATMALHGMMDSVCKEVA